MMLVPLDVNIRKQPSLYLRATMGGRPCTNLTPPLLRISALKAFLKTCIWAFVAKLSPCRKKRLICTSTQEKTRVWMRKATWTSHV